MGFLSKIFGDANEKYLKEIQPAVEKINALEPEFRGFSNEKLKEKTLEFKERMKKGESLDEILPEAFALVREAAKRELNQRHFDVQLIGGIILHQGKIAEMKTGEGKTLSSTLPLYLNALDGNGCHLITINDYLAKRDAVWMGQIYHLLGLSVGCIIHEAAFIYDPNYQREIQNSKLKIQNDDSKLKIDEKDKERDIIGGFKVIESYLRPVTRREAYAADITYGTNNEFGFDYLRDNMAHDLKDRVQREMNFAIIDEVDSILIDEARTPLIISAPDMESSKMYGDFARIIPRLEKSDYEIDEKMKAATLTESGINRIEKILGVGDIYQEKGIKYLHHLEQALRAEVLFKRDRDYVVKDGQIIIVDEFTGRLMPGRRWSGGLHQAIEAKENVRVQAESITLSSITFQNYFRMYKKLAGMTGTALTSAEEFDKVYKLEAIAVPTNKPMIRKDLPDRVYKTESGKYKAVVAEIKIRHSAGQPVLVGTTSIVKNEYLGKLLEREGVSHQILNAKHHEKEGQIIAQAGRLGAVTIATNMAGRGVDIMLGGYPPSKSKIQNPEGQTYGASPKSKIDEENDEFKKYEEEHNKVIELGGLHIIGTERHEARRIDNQLRGRSGRQGDSGSSQFYLSLEDDILRIFGGDKVKSLMEMLKVPEDEPIEAGIISGVIESAQEKIEGANFDLRKHVLEYDDVMNKHREIIYKKRKEIIENGQKSELKPQILEMAKRTGFAEEDYEKKEKEIGAEAMRQIEKIACLRVLDMLWVDHLENMEYLRDSVRLRAYGQQDPLIEYKNEGRKMFQHLLTAFETNAVQTILRAQISSQKSLNRPTGTLPVGRPVSGAGRNSPCPCGSGKKFKKCHGQ